jgi:hypothetical protein
MRQYARTSSKRSGEPRRAVTEHEWWIAFAGFSLGVVFQTIFLFAINWLHG